ncbi:hypothetical protein BHU72_13490 [Desulfuribacillus stibiiarsenatis]|uniref:HTH marR-type domain-containing protein n=1 Tax=Desulfuribacillus stibiiarsenatis TaxID=1390249 RepID=A0A1E5L8H6_9FIRM|nr:MarR family transcriptional regulator [Desulfuribacillus stibiiarsenatis]OEH86426.1 hypothetical protein BHU72_13490 [Desulfuribacillus stibiiarsenatis]
MEDFSQNLGYLLSKSAKIMKWHFNEALKNYDLTAAQWSVIKDLSIQMELLHASQNSASGIQGHPLSPAAVALRLYYDRPTISGIIDRLEKNGWVVRKPNPDDRRSQIIELTEKSESLIHELNHHGNDIMERAVAGFDSDELVALKAYLGRMIVNLSKEGD